MISFTVMAHPSRKQYAETLPYPIVWDRGKGLWDTASRAWQSHSSEEYHCVIQDDAILCSNFEKRLNSIIAPGIDCLCLYVGKARNKRHLFNRKGLFHLDNLFWGVGIVLKTKHIPAMIEYGNTTNLNMDDVIINNYCLRNHLPVWYHLPCLVDHRHLRSLAKNSNGRRDALCFWE